MKHIELTEFEIALEKVLHHTTPITTTEFVSIFEANTRVLAQDLFCQKPLPSFDNSAMDGYAVLRSDAGKRVKIADTSFAGDHLSELQVTQGVCHKIMTGAIVPTGADAIVPFEDAQVISPTEIMLPTKIKKSAHIRFLGEETHIKDRLLTQGTYLRAAELALLASQGVSSVKVFSKPKVAVISSGNELVEPWDQAKPHQIYNSNSIGIFSFLQTLGAKPTYIGALPDDKEVLKDSVEKLTHFDLVVSSGGVSVGEADYTAEIFEEAGLEIIIHGINTKPGKHGMFGKMGTTYVLGLPGNPLSSMSMFLTFVAPLFSKLSGRESFYPNYLYARVKEEFSIKANKSHIIHGTVKNGEFQAFNNYKYSSGMLTPLTQSNSYIVTNKECRGFKKGEWVKVILHSEMNTSENISFKSSN